MRNNDDYIPENEQQNTNQTTEQQDTTNSTPEENGGNGERLFTQEEVNRIIAERLARERAKSGPSEEERKVQELARQELRLRMKQSLFDAGCPVDAILTSLTTSTSRPWRDLSRPCTGWTIFSTSITGRLNG